MALEPKAFFNFAAEHYPLLLDIYNQGSDLSQSEVHEYISRHKSENSSRPDYIFNQLINLKFIQPTPEASAYYEITYHVKDLLTVLEQEHRFTSTKEIQAYLDEIDSLRQRLEVAIKEEKQGLIFTILEHMSVLVERLRQSSNGNRMAIIREVHRVKLNAQKESTESRYETILDIYERFITPLQDMIEIDKSLDKGLQQLEVLLHYAEKRYDLEKDILFKLRKVSLHLPRLRNDLLSNFKESTNEIAPLLQKLQANLFGRGVTKILREVGKRGGKALEDIAAKLSLPPTRSKSDLFDDFKTIEFLRQVKGYRPTSPPVIDHENHHVDRGVIVSPQKLLAEFRQGLPTSDVLEWLRENHHDKTPKTILIMYKKIIDNAERYSFSEVRKTYPIGKFNVNARPLRIEELKENVR